MHNTQIRQDVIERIERRRGRRHVHSVIDPNRSALIVIDMQNAFVDPGRPSAVPVAQQIVPNINRLADAMRQAGSTVVWIYSTFSRATLTEWSAFFGGIYSPEFSTAVIDNLTAGSPGHEFYPALNIVDNDLKISKDRFSAFLPGHCELEDTLRAKQLDTVVIAGTLTNVCCESSARDALMRNFNVIMAADANAAFSDADHNASMTALAQTFADVMDCDTIIERLAVR